MHFVEEKKIAKFCQKKHQTFEAPPHSQQPFPHCATLVARNIRHFSVVSFSSKRVHRTMKGRNTKRHKTNKGSVNPQQMQMQQPKFNNNGITNVAPNPFANESSQRHRKMPQHQNCRGGFLKVDDVLANLTNVNEGHPEVNDVVMVDDGDGITYDGANAHTSQISVTTTSQDFRPLHEQRRFIRANIGNTAQEASYGRYSSLWQHVVKISGKNNWHTTFLASGISTRSKFVSNVVKALVPSSSAPLLCYHGRQSR